MKGWVTRLDSSGNKPQQQQKQQRQQQQQQQQQQHSNSNSNRTATTATATATTKDEKSKKNNACLNSTKNYKLKKWLNVNCYSFKIKKMDYYYRSRRKPSILCKSRPNQPHGRKFTTALHFVIWFVTSIAPYCNTHLQQQHYFNI